MNVRNFGLASGLGGIASGLFGMNGGGGKNPYDAASGFMNQIPGATNPYYQPYAQAGSDAMHQLQGQYSNLINDPSAMFNKIASGYQQSPGLKWQMGQGMNAANNAAAAGGMLGSPQHQQQAATMSEGLANQDYWNYMQNALGSSQNQYGLGLQGLQGLNNQGFQANDQMARIMADMLSGQGQMAFAGQAAQNQQRGSSMGDLFGGLSSLIGFL